ncbi:MAG: hypothetical protein QM756_09950 [Polyangiaceae bacterium]
METKSLRGKEIRMHIGKQLFGAALVVLLALVSFSALAFDLQPFTASYKFNIDNKLSGSATRTLEKEKRRFLALYLCRQSSHGHGHRNQWLPF